MLHRGNVSFAEALSIRYKEKSTWVENESREFQKLEAMTEGQRSRQFHQTEQGVMDGLRRGR